MFVHPPSAALASQTPCLSFHSPWQQSVAEGHRPLQGCCPITMTENFLQNEWGSGNRCPAIALATVSLPLLFPITIPPLFFSQVSFLSFLSFSLSFPSSLFFSFVSTPFLHFLIFIRFPSFNQAPICTAQSDFAGYSSISERNVKRKGEGKRRKNAERGEKKSN